MLQCKGRGVGLGPRLTTPPSSSIRTVLTRKQWIHVKAIPTRNINYTVGSRKGKQEPPAPIDSIFDSLSSFDEEPETSYKDQNIKDIIKQRSGWLGLFCAGLIVSAFVIEGFEDVIEQQVALAFFVPLIMGHGGNTGSQTVSTLIRALALRQVRWRDATGVMLKEAVAGGVMGGMLGLGVLCLAAAGVLGKAVNAEVGVVLFVAMPAVSLWSNMLAAFITLASHKLKLDPAMTSGPLVATMVDTSGLLLYFLIAQAVIHNQPYAHALELMQQLVA